MRRSLLFEKKSNGNSHHSYSEVKRNGKRALTQFITILSNDLICGSHHTWRIRSRRRLKFGMSQFTQWLFELMRLRSYRDNSNECSIETLYYASLTSINVIRIYLIAQFQKEILLLYLRQAAILLELVTKKKRPMYQYVCLYVLNFGQVYRAQIFVDRRISNILLIKGFR